MINETPRPTGDEPSAQPASQHRGEVTGRVLIADGGKFTVPPEARRMLVLTDDGLFVEFGQRRNMHVLDFIARLRRNQHEYQTYYTSFTAISRAYEEQKNTVEARASRGSGAFAEEQHRIVELLTQGLSDDASDIHFIIRKHESDVRFRIMGELETKHALTQDEGMRLVSSLYGSMCDVAQSAFNPSISQDARLNAQYTEELGLYGARVATRPTHDGVLMVLRLLKSDNTILTHQQLGFLPQQVQLFEEMASRSYGMAVISGPTGSGKSRTLQATMNMILRGSNDTLNLITIEDPPEYPIPGANVTPLKVKDRSDPAMVSAEWRGAISNAMRLDPDIIMVGEIRDRDSANTGFAAAMTGHGVWGTLHANDATSIAERMIDMGVEREKVTDPTLLSGLTAQRLLPVLCERCKIPLSQAGKRISAPVLHRLKQISSPAALQGVHVRGDGCDTCRMRGIKTRAPVIEAIVPTLEFMEQMRAGGKLAARRYWVNSMNGITLNRHALHLVWNGLVDPSSAEAVTPLDFDNQILGVSYANAPALV